MSTCRSWRNGGPCNRRALPRGASVVVQAARWAAALAVVVAVVLLAGSRSEAGPFEIAGFRLDNGLEVVVISDHRAPVVTQMLWYRVGSADEEPGKSGLAHLVEHLMFRGASTGEQVDASTLIKRIGGEENAFTSHDYTAYHQTVVSDRLGVIMELEARRMARLEVLAGDLEIERKVVLEERFVRVANSDAARFREQVNAATWLAYPYRLPVIGWEHEIRALEFDDVMEFHRRWYGPDNAVLVLAGDITEARARRLARRYYGAIPRRDIAPRARVGEPEQVAPRRLSMRSSQVGQPSWQRRYIAPGYATGLDDAHALEVLSVILGGGTTSRLYRSLVVEQELAVSAGCWYRSDALGPTTFGFYASPSPGVGLDVLEAAVDAEIDRVLAKGVTARERDTAVRRLRRSGILASDTVAGSARIIGAALVTGRSLEEIRSWPERVAAVTVEDIRRVAASVFRLERSVTGELRPSRP